ncbi:MAG: response regulator transcription factor [Cephaloticoccus sp.]|nr:response regulator transcription factor [Cephaloticoccus sp.]
MTRVLLIEDEDRLARSLKIGLEDEGYRVERASDGEEGLLLARAERHDALILDLRLPRLSGLELCRRLRSKGSRLPILMLTASDTTDAIVEGLDAGADDYLTKPFGGRELLARMRAVMRRTQPNEESTVVHFGEIEIDLAARLVRRQGVEVHLTMKEYALLRLLVQHRGKVVTHQQILREIWGPTATQNTHYLRVHMTHLRQKIETDPQAPRHLKTDAGIGYRLVE